MVCITYCNVNRPYKIHLEIFSTSDYVIKELINMHFFDSGKKCISGVIKVKTTHIGKIH